MSPTPGTPDVGRITWTYLNPSTAKQALTVARETETEFLITDTERVTAAVAMRHEEKGRVSRSEEELSPAELEYMDATRKMLRARHIAALATETYNTFRLAERHGRELTYLGTWHNVHRYQLTPLQEGETL